MKFGRSQLRNEEQFLSEALQKKRKINLGLCYLLGLKEI